MYHIFSILLLILHSQQIESTKPGLYSRIGKEPKKSEYDNRPRGVSFVHGSLYATGETFTCIDGTKTIPFDQVNDDYCDCADGSDEPGTSACPNGKFHCVNSGFEKIDIPSNRVNDQICDCCDGSDEWDGSVECKNVCIEMGAEKRAQKQAKIAIAQKGYAKKLELIEQGEKMKAEKELELISLKKEVDEIVLNLELALQEKMAAEDLERIAKEQADKLWQEKKNELKRIEAKVLFDKLDVNSDSKLTVEDMKQYVELDSNNDGQVSDEEAKDALVNHEERSFDEFVETVYDTVKWHFIKEEEKDQETEEAGVEGKEESAEKSMEIPDNLSDEERKVFETTRKSHKSQTKHDEDGVQYDEETTKLIENADSARNKFNELDAKNSITKEKIRDIESLITDNFGPDSAWITLKGNCYEMNDNQYVYKLCPFDRTVQKERNGHSEINLGLWKNWSGPEGNLYSEQSYENGQSCWNGPERSTILTIECGEETSLIDVNEPSKCIYHFTFQTPAACPDPATLEEAHDEL